MSAENAAQKAPEARRELAVKRVPIASLLPDPANARAHNERNVETVRSSLARFGQAEPLVVQAGTRRIIGGHARLAAMKALGWQECDVVEIELSNLDATALGIALNRTAELAEWDERVLADLLKSLQAEDGLEGVGFSEQELDDLIASLDTNEPALIDDPGPGEPPVNPVTRSGDLWILGEHRLLCGDSTKSDDIARVLNGEKARLLSSDPPYCVNYTGDNRPVHNGKRSGKDWSHIYREVDIADLGEFLDAFLRAALPRIEDDAPVYLWHAHVQQPTVAEVFERHGILFHQVLVWVKPTPVFGHSYYQWQHEPCAFGWRRGHKPQHGQGQLASVWQADWEGKARVVGNEHPTQKPLRLFEIPMEQHTRPRDLVLEPFSGSGSQLVAAEKLMRRCAALELSPAFVDVAIRRWEGASGKEALLEGTSKTYAVIAEERGVR